MSDELLVCLTKSLLSQNFYWTMFDLSKTLISHPVSVWWIDCFYHVTYAFRVNQFTFRLKKYVFMVNLPVAFTEKFSSRLLVKVKNINSFRHSNAWILSPSSESVTNTFKQCPSVAPVFLLLTLNRSLYHIMSSK